MNDDRFDTMVRQLGAARSRRSALRIFGGAVVGTAVTVLFGAGRAHAQLCPLGQICCGPGGLLASIEDCLAGGGTCINPFADANNCGFCGTVCSGALPVCVGAVCTAAHGGGGNAPAAPTAPAAAPSAPTAAPTVPPAAPSAPTAAPTAPSTSGGGGGGGQGGCSGLTLCNPGSASPYCADLQHDDNNCGFCGYWCGVYGICENGACVCRQGYTRCGGQGTDAVCSDTTVDDTNCDFCGNVCPGAQVCQNSRCVCPAGQTC